jgi:hypothetical protein
MTWARVGVVFGALLVIALVALLALRLVVHREKGLGPIRYVATSGSDSNPGTQALPWRTIQKAANTMVAGDTCVVLPGSYGERVQVSRSGSPGAPVTYRAEGTVTMRGFTVLANYITVAGFDISDTADNPREGIGVFVQGRNCVIEGNYIHDIRYGAAGNVNPHIDCFQTWRPAYDMGAYERPGGRAQASPTASVSQ